MKISIAMCTYNGANFLLQQLQSIAEQTRLPDEVVVCDDCSQDETPDIIRDFALTVPFSIRFYRNETNLKVVKNFEKAINLCDGDIIFLSDQDDEWHPQKIEIFYREFEKSPEVGLVFCDAEFVDSDLNSLNRRLFELLDFNEKQQKAFVKGAEFSQLIHQNVVIGCASAFRTKYKDLINPIPTDIPLVIHDYWIALILAVCSSVVPISKPLVKYRQHPAQLTGYVNMLNRILPASLDLRQRIQTKNNFSEYIEKLTLCLERAAAVRKRMESYSGSSYLKLDSFVFTTEQEILHFSHRQQLPKLAFAQKIAQIGSELFSRRYHRYSKGFRSVVRDLLY